jgi:hypothetical protein
MTDTLSSFSHILTFYSFSSLFVCLGLDGIALLFKRAFTYVGALYYRSSSSVRTRKEPVTSCFNTWSVSMSDGEQWGAQVRIIMGSDYQDKTRNSGQHQDLALSSLGLSFQVIASAILTSPSPTVPPYLISLFSSCFHPEITIVASASLGENSCQGTSQPLSFT